MLLKNPIQKAMLALITFGFIATTANMFGNYLDLPVVALDQNKECLWIRMKPDFEVMQNCPEVLPDRYEVEHVRFVKAD